MFKLIDADNSGEITVHEMHAVVSDLLGLDLSVEDVFNVVQDIDEDGNGELDLEEFEVLLERFGIFEDFMHVAK
jgi:Ca2+-binding EF-hand superfamily protein